MGERAAIYARVSTDDQRGNYSVPTQLAACVTHLKRCGYSLVGDRFVDRTTGQDVSPSPDALAAFVDDYTSLEVSRPGLAAALEFLDASGFDVLIVHALDRLARDPYIRETLEREFEKRDARVEFVLGNYDDSAEGEVRKDLDATFAKWENAKRVERSLRGKRGKAERGLFVGGRAPLGFRIDRKANGGLVIDETHAATVQRIFGLYVGDGSSLTGIARRLTQDGVLTWNGKTIWRKSSVVKILQNPAYVGRCFYNKFKRVGKSLARRKTSEWIEIKVPAIVDQATFDEAQERLRQNGEALRRLPSRFYLLSGKVFCENCKHTYNAQAKRAGTNRLKNDALHYRHRINQGHCLNRMISARTLEPRVWHEITQMLLHPARLRKGYKGSLAQAEANRARQTQRLDALKPKAAKLDQQRENLTTAYVDPDIKMSKAEFIKQKSVIDRDLKRFNDERERIEAELARMPVSSDIKSLEKFASSIRDRLAGKVELSPSDKREVLDMLNVKVWISKDGSGRIEGRFDEPRSGVSSTTCSHCADLLQQSRARVSHALVHAPQRNLQRIWQYRSTGVAPSDMARSAANHSSVRRERRAFQWE